MQCKEPAVFVCLQDGHAERFLCFDHGVKVLQAAVTLKVDLSLIPLTDSVMKDISCGEAESKHGTRPEIRPLHIF